MFKELTDRLSYPALEQEILRFWKERRIFEQSISNDAARVILPGVELLPVDVVELGAHLVAQAIFRPVCHALDRAHHFAEALRVAWQLIWADDKERDQQDDEYLVESQPAETHSCNRIALSLVRSTAQHRAPTH